MNTKTKELLIDLAHEIHQAIITDDEYVAQQALGDVAAALASIVPAERIAARSGVRALPNRRVAKYNTINASDINALSVTIPGHKITGHVEHSDPAPSEWEGDIFENGVIVASVLGYGRGKNFVTRVTKFAMRGVASYVGKHRRRTEKKR